MAGEGEGVMDIDLGWAERGEGYYYGDGAARLADWAVANYRDGE